MLHIEYKFTDKNGNDYYARPSGAFWSKNYKTYKGAERMLERIANIGFKNPNTGKPFTADEINEFFHIVGTPESHNYSNNANTADIKIGDVFHGVYGYEAQYHDFFEVVSISPSGSTITVRELKQTQVPPYPHHYGDVTNIIPVLSGVDRYYGEPIRKRVRAYENGNASIKVNSFERAMKMNPDTINSILNGDTTFEEYNYH